MTVKSDDQRRWVEMGYVLPGTPEQLWRALATGPGMAAWFTVASVEPHVGGTIAFSFADELISSGNVTVWDPPRRFCYEERDWKGDAPPVATEITITARSGNICVVRMVHSLFTTADTWDGELESFESGWPQFFRVLELYLRQFVDQKAGLVFAQTATHGTLRDAWKRLSSALGVAGSDVGDPRSAPAGAPVLAGIVEYVEHSAKSSDVLLRLEAPHPGAVLIGAHGWKTAPTIGVALYLYGDDAADAAAKLQPAWRDWIKTLA